MGKAKGKGGFIGGIFEAVGEIAKCLCCMMLIGPLLMFIGIYFLQSSFSDPRGKLVLQYNSDVDIWNKGPGADGSFQELEIHAKLTTDRKTQVGLPMEAVTVLLGEVAPEDTGDSSQSADETFTAVIDPYYYATERDDKTINTVYPSYDGDNINNPAGSSVTLSFEGAGVGNSPSTMFYPVVNFDVPYSWYCSGSSSSNSGSGTRRRRRRRGSSSRSSSSSSSSCDNTCDDPNSSYRNLNVDYCPDWCTGSGGEWIDNGRCYDSSSTTKKATGCCVQKWGATKACFTSQVVTPKSKVNLYATPCSTNKGQVTSTDKTVQYGVMGSSSWGIGMEISVRNSKDPYIAVSKMTDGCSSGTSNLVPQYTTDSTTSASSRCFGATAAELRSYATMFFLAGAMFSIFPAAVLYFLFKKSNGSSSRRNRPGVAQVQNPHMQQQQQFGQQQQYGQQQPIIIQQQQQPVIIQQQQQQFGQQQQQFGQQQQQFAQQKPTGQFVQAQPVQAAVYQPQPVQPMAVVQPMPVPVTHNQAGGATWNSK